MAHLFLFQIGPVQTFIAAGRRTQDLYVGSRILSQLAAAGVLAAVETANFQAVFPVFVDQRLPQGVPHRFAFISDSSVPEVAERVETAIRQRWRGYADRVYQYLRKRVGSGTWEATFARQQENWLEFYYVAVSYEATQHSESLRLAARAMAQRKLLRHFPQIEEPGRKCTLTGAQSALELPWSQLRDEIHDEESIVLRENEYLGTVALIKRLARRAKGDLGDDFPNVISTRDIAGIPREDFQAGRQVEGYFAILHMDGDRMGQRLSELHTLAEHQQFSATLAHFAEVEVPRIVQEIGGSNAQLVYAGGDDVLALLPLRTALACAYALRHRFEVLTGCTASAGIAITPYNFPLDVGLEMARKAEEIAKDQYGRDAILVTEAHGTGQIREAGGNWEILPLVEDLQRYFEAGTLSGKLGFDLLTVASSMTGNREKISVVQPEARRAEVLRLLRRRTAEGTPDPVRQHIEQLAESVAYWGDQVITDHNRQLAWLNWTGVAHWTILARFLAQPVREYA